MWWSFCVALLLYLLPVNFSSLKSCFGLDFLFAGYPGITLESAIPCESQAAKWSEALRDRYFDIASKCDKETLIQTHYSPDCMDKRNRYMVDQADVLIAVWDGSPSGTGKTVRYAHQQGKSVTVIDPVSLDVTQE